MLDFYSRLMALMTDIREREDGVTAIEYGLIAALIAVAIIASITIVGTQLAAVFTAVSDALTAAL